MCMRNVMQIRSLFITPIFCRMGWRRGNSIQNVSLRYSIAIDYKFHIETVNIDEAIDVTWLYFKCNSWKFFLSMFSLVYAFRIFRRILFLFILACLACISQTNDACLPHFISSIRNNFNFMEIYENDTHSNEWETKFVK